MSSCLIRLAFFCVLFSLVWAASAAAFAQQSGADAPPSPVEAIAEGRYLCYQGGLTSRGASYWGYFDLQDGTYTPFTGTGGAYAYDGKGELTFEGGIFERYTWVGVARLREDGTTEIVLMEAADLDAFLRGERSGGGSGYLIYCGLSED